MGILVGTGRGDCFMQTDVGTSRRTRTQWQALLGRAAHSGVAELCRREGVSTVRFYAWRKRLGAAAAQVPPAVTPRTGQRELRRANLTVMA
jgi:hypothetical protein